MSSIYQSRVGSSLGPGLTKVSEVRRGQVPSKEQASAISTFKGELSKIQKGYDHKVTMRTKRPSGDFSSSSTFEYTVKKGDTLWELAVKRFHVNLEDLIRDNNIENPNLIFPGQKLIIRRPEIAGSQEVTASWYGADYHGKPMANGDPFDMNGATIAHKHIPLGTRVELENPTTGEKVRAVVTDRGPFVPGRDVDLSYGLAKRLSLVSQGVGKLIMKVL